MSTANWSVVTPWEGMFPLGDWERALLYPPMQGKESSVKCETGINHIYSLQETWDTCLMMFTYPYVLCLSQSAPESSAQTKLVHLSVPVYT